jgi:hypothetical protein
MDFFSENLYFRSPKGLDYAFIVARLDTQQVTCISRKDLFVMRYLVPSYNFGILYIIQFCMNF